MNRLQLDYVFIGGRLPGRATARAAFKEDLRLLPALEDIRDKAFAARDQLEATLEQAQKNYTAAKRKARKAQRDVDNLIQKRRRNVHSR